MNNRDLKKHAKERVEMRDGQIFESKIQMGRISVPGCRERNLPVKRIHGVAKFKRALGVRYVTIHPWTKNPIPATISVASMSRMNSCSGNRSRIFFPTNEPKIIIDPSPRPITILSDVRIETRL